MATRTSNLPKSILVLGTVVLGSVLLLALLAMATGVRLPTVNPVLAILVIALTFPCLVAIFDFSRGLYIYLYLLPFSYFLKRLLFLYPGVTQTEWFIASGLTDVVLICAIINLIQNKGYRVYNSAIHLPVSIFLVWCVLEIFNPNISLVIGIGGFKKTAIYIAMYYLTLAVILRTEKQGTVTATVDRIANITVICSVIAAGYGFIQSFFGLTSFEMEHINSGVASISAESIGVLYAQGMLRAFSTFSGPWVFGDYLVIGFTFNILAYMRGRIGSVRLVLTAVWLALGILVSLSRSSFLMLLLTVVIFYILEGRWKQRLAWRLTMGGSLVAIAIGATLTYGEQVTGDLGTAIFSLYNLFGRINVWQSLIAGGGSAFSLIGEGIGSEQASFYFGRTLVEDPHSFLFTLTLELGLVGLGTFIWIMVALTRNTIRTLVVGTSRDDRLTINIVLSLVFGMIIAKTVAGGLWGLQIHDNYLWMFVGLLAGMCVIQKQVEAPVSGRSLSTLMQRAAPAANYLRPNE